MSKNLYQPHTSLDGMISTILKHTYFSYSVATKFYQWIKLQECEILRWTMQGDIAINPLKPTVHLTGRENHQSVS